MAGEQQPVSRDVLEGAVELAAVARQANLHYALIGGLAAGYRTQPRFTQDVDFLLQIPQLQLPAVLDDLTAHGFVADPVTTIREWTREHMTTLSFRGVRVDWLKPVIPLYQHVLDRATDETLLNQPIRIATAEGLILVKLLAYRPQDVVDIENLVAAHRETLDLDWIQSEWATVGAADHPRMRQLVELVGRGDQNKVG
jgi:hypothetical protein